jgi:CheY-like chemotaxis protein
MFTNAGSVEVRGRVAGSAFDPAKADLVISVTDTGIGIDADMQERIFGRFERGHDSPSVYPGSGLGLTIARGLVEAMGGTISVESTPSAGSSFTFSAPIGIVPGKEGVVPLLNETSGEGFSSVQGLDVLLVEDNYFNQRVFHDLLARQGHAVTVAATGQEALELGGARRFDLVLMDIRMPDMDGCAVARKLRGSGYRGAIIAVTADAGDAAGDRCIEAGMDDVCVKPVKLDVLLDKIAILCGVPTAVGSSPAGFALHDLFDPDAIPGLHGDREALQTYVRLLASDVERSLGLLGEAVSRRDFPAVARLAHTLKGTTGVMRSSTLSLIAKQLQEGADGGDGPSVNRHFESFAREHDRIRRLFDAYCCAERTGDDG